MTRLMKYVGLMLMLAAGSEASWPFSWPLGRNTNGDCLVSTKCSTWLSFSDMDPGLYIEVDGET